MRLKSELWVKAYLRRCEAAGSFAVVAHRGHDTAGSIYIRINLLDGTSKLFVPAPIGLSQDFADRQWMPALDGIVANDATVDSYIEKQLQLDPDFWVVEVEDRNGRCFLDEQNLVDP